MLVKHYKKGKTKIDKVDLKGLRKLEVDPDKDLIENCPTTKSLPEKFP